MGQLTSVLTEEHVPRSQSHLPSAGKQCCVLGLVRSRVPQGSGGAGFAEARPSSARVRTARMPWLDCMAQNRHKNVSRLVVTMQWWRPGTKRLSTQRMYTPLKTRRPKVQTLGSPRDYKKGAEAAEL